MPFAKPGATDLPIPPGLLRPGRNLLTISGRQTHRVLCGPGAGFDLWTQLDPDRSGVAVSAKDLGPVSDIAWLHRCSSGRECPGRGDPGLPAGTADSGDDRLPGRRGHAPRQGDAELSPSFDVALGGTDAVGRPRIVVAGGSDAVSVRPAADGAAVLLLQGAPGDLLARLWADAAPLAGDRPPRLSAASR